PYTIIRSKFVNSTVIQKEALFQWPEISLIPNSRCGIYVSERDGMFTIAHGFSLVVIPDMELKKREANAAATQSGFPQSGTIVK
ncbi:MAG: hypothetical protein WBC11_04355, partial [Dehalococcoidia bacterium]